MSSTMSPARKMTAALVLLTRIAAVRGQSEEGRIDDYSAGFATPVVTELGYEDYMFGDMGSAAGATIVQLSLELSAAQANIYSIFATPDTPAMQFPVAWNSLDGVDISTAVDTPLDSYLTIGNGNGVIANGVIDFDSWSANGLTVTNGSLELSDPALAPFSTIKIAQLIVQCGNIAYSATVNARGHSIIGIDWQQDGIMFDWESSPCLPTFSSGAAAPVVTELATTDLGSIGMMTTFQLSLSLSSAEANLYSLYASPDSTPMVFPPAFQSAFSGDIGVTQILLEYDNYDSYLTIGDVSDDALAVAGIDFTAWTTDGLHVTDGGLIYMEPLMGPSGTVLIAQLTVGCEVSATASVNAQGLSINQSVNADWQQESIVFDMIGGPCAVTLPTDAVSGIATIVSPIESGTIVQLSLVLSATEQSVYGIYATPLTAPMEFPAVVAQSGTFTIGNGSGVVIDTIDSSNWVAGLSVVEGSVELADWNTAAPGNSMIVEFTIPWDSCGEFSASVNAHGLSADGNWWEQEEILFAWTLPCFRAASDVSASIEQSSPVSTFPMANSFVSVDVFLHLSESEPSLAAVSVTASSDDAVIVLVDSFVGTVVGLILVATVQLPLNCYGDVPVAVEITINAHGATAYDIVQSGLDWQQQLVFPFYVPQGAGCPFDSRSVTVGYDLLAWDGHLLIDDLLALLAHYGYCVDPTGLDPIYSECSTEFWVGYPFDGSPENDDGTWGDGVINVHDLLGLLGNYHRDYVAVPCV